MNPEEITNKLSEITEAIDCPVFIAIQTPKNCIVYGNEQMKHTETKEKQSIAFCLLHTIINVFSDFDTIPTNNNQE